MTSERYIPEHRRTQFKAKNTFKPDELRRRREEQQVEIRKQKREENLAKRRGISGRDGLTAPGASLGASIDSDDDGGTIESQVCSILSFYKSSFRLDARFSLFSHNFSPLFWQCFPVVSSNLELLNPFRCHRAFLGETAQCVPHPSKHKFTWF